MPIANGRSVNTGGSEVKDMKDSRQRLMELSLSHSSCVDSGSEKEAIDIINGTDPLDSLFLDYHWAVNAKDILTRFCHAARSADEKLVVRHMQSVDGIIQYSLRNSAATGLMETFKFFDGLLKSMDTITVQKKYWEECKAYFRAVFFIRAAAYINLKIRRNNLASAFSKYVCVCLVKALNLLSTVLQDNKASNTWFYVSACMEALEVDAMLQCIQVNEKSELFWNSVQIALQNKQTATEICKVVLGSGTSQYLRSLSTPLVPQGQAGYTPMDKARKEQYWNALLRYPLLLMRDDFLERLVWVMRCDQKMAEENSANLKQAFTKIPYARDELSTCSIESLTFLDIAVFVRLCMSYGTIRSVNRDTVMPMRLLDYPAIDDKHRQIWKAAYALTHELNRPDLRPQLLSMVETVRLTAGDNLDFRLLMAVADYLMNLFTKSSDESEKEGIREFAIRYWHRLYEIIDRPPVSPPTSLFYVGMLSTNGHQRAGIKDKATFCLGTLYVNKRQNDTALEWLDKCQSPQAKQYQAKILSSMANDVDESDSAEAKEKKEVLIAKAQEALDESISSVASYDASLNLNSLVPPRPDRFGLDRTVDSVARRQSIGVPTNAIVDFFSRAEQNNATVLQAVMDNNREAAQRFENLVQDSTRRFESLFTEYRSDVREEMREHSKETNNLVKIVQEQASETSQLNRELITELKEARNERRDLMDRLGDALTRKVEQQPPTAPPYHVPAAYPYPADVYDGASARYPPQQGAFWPAPPGQHAHAHGYHMPQQHNAYAGIQQPYAHGPVPVDEAAALRDQVLARDNQPFTLEEIDAITQQALDTVTSDADLNLSNVLAGLANNIRAQADHNNEKKLPTPVPVCAPKATVATSSVVPTNTAALPSQVPSTQAPPWASLAAPAPAAAASATAATSVGGFSFSKPPVITDVKEKENDKKEPEKQSSIFEKFTGFGSPPRTQATTQPSKPLFSFSQNTSTTAAPSSLFGTPPSNTSISFTTTNVAKSPVKDGPTTPDQGADEHFEPQVEFTPVVPLPDLVEVKTGEENEKVIFCHRAKLFRFVEGEYKERGLGDLKILEDKTTARRRLILRREQVHKLAANHQINGLMKLTPMLKSDKAYTWFAQDFADEQLKEETFAAKFKTPEIAQQFKTAFEESVKIMAQYKSPQKAKEQKPAKPTEKPAAGFGDKFKPKAGTWECKGCLIRNQETAQECVCCGTGKDGAPPKPGKRLAGPSTFAAAPAASSGFSFGIKKDEATPKTESQEKPKNLFAFGAKPEGANAAQPSVFGQVAATPTHSLFGQAAHSKPTEQAKPIFGQTTPSIFGQAVAAAPPAPAPTASIFGQAAAAKPIFGQAAADPSSGNTSFAALAVKKEGASVEQKDWFGHLKLAEEAKRDIKPMFGSPASENKPDPDESAGADEHFEPEVEFAPVVPLPDLVEVQTGEEHENEMFCHRAKIFRFVDGEFKERGLGDLKILKHKDTGKYRLLLRREQVHKLAANHSLKPGMSLQPMETSEKAFVWNAMDFSEGELRPETLAARFKTAEIANQFQEAFENAVEDAAPETPEKAEKPRGKPEKEQRNAPSTPVTPNIVAKSADSKSTTPSQKVATPDSFSFKPSSIASPENKTNSPFGGTGSLFGAGCSPFGGAGTGQSPSTFETNTSGPKGFGSFGPLFGTSKPAPEATPESKGASGFSFKLAGSSKQTPSSASSESVQLVYDAAKDLSEDEKQRARALQLPESFFAYTRKADCTGCIGCGSDREVDQILSALDELALIAPVDDADDEYNVRPSLDQQYEDGEWEDEEGSDDAIWTGNASLKLKYLKDDNFSDGVNGEVHVSFDDDVDAYRLQFFDEDGEQIMNHIIVQEYQLDVKGKKHPPWTASWVANDFTTGKSEEKQFLLTFNNLKTLMEFKENFDTGIALSINNNVHIETPEECFTAQGSDIDPRIIEAMKSSVEYDPDSRINNSGFEE